LEEFFKSIGEPKFRVTQVLDWIYKKKVLDFSSFSNLSKRLREKLEENFVIKTLSIEEIHESKDGSIKIAFKTFDDKYIESVIIPSKDRVTLCISTQIGCNIGCAFCNTARLGLIRNLYTSEILEQYLLSESIINKKITNIVYMGMGEPLVNFDNFLNSLERFISEEYFNFGKRKIVVSTIGIPEKIRRLADFEYAPKISLSLHFSTDEERKKYIPVSYKIDELVESLYYYYKMTNLPITYEYLLLNGINTSQQHMEKLYQIVSLIPKSKINLIPFNEFEGSSFSTPDVEEIERFKEFFKERGIFTSVRTSYGRDISAACGNLGFSLLKRDLVKRDLKRKS